MNTVQHVKLIPTARVASLPCTASPEITYRKPSPSVRFTMVLIKIFSAVATAIPKMIARAPLLTAVSLIGAGEVMSSALTHFTSVPLEVADVFSLLLGNAVSVLFYANSARKLPQKVILACTSAWALRLSSFLAKRTYEGFHDDRLDNMRNSTSGASIWCLTQTLWIFCTLLPVWVTTSRSPQVGLDHSLHAIDYAALAGFFTGFYFEVRADAQKKAFLNSLKDPQVDSPPFCDKGLFKLCRFPNYFGEFLMWSSLSVFAATKSTSWIRFLLPVGPAFIYTAFHKASIPMAISKMKKRLSEKDFQRWSDIPLFFPRFPKS